MTPEPNFVKPLEKCYFEDTMDLNRQLKWFTGVLVGFTALLPVSALASEFRHGDELIIREGETFSQDLYVMGERVEVKGKVEGDLTVVGGSVMVAGEVAGDVLVIGGQVQVDGLVNDDVRVVGGDVEINGTVRDGLVTVAGNTVVNKTALIGGDVRAVAGQLSVNGTSGDVWAAVGDLSVGETANIDGGLYYTSREEAQIAEGAKIRDQVTFRQVKAPQGMDRVWQVLQGGGVVSILLTILLGILLIYVMPHKTVTLAESWRTHFGLNIVWGLIFLVSAPLVALLLIISIVGLPIGIGVILLYPILLYLGWLVSMLALGAFIYKAWRKSEAMEVSWLTVVLGAVVWWVIRLIPYIGWAVVFVFFLVGVGALLRFDWQLFKRLRNDGTL